MGASPYNRAVYEFRRSIGYYARHCPTCGQGKRTERYCPTCPRPAYRASVEVILEQFSNCVEGRRTPKPECRLSYAEWPLPHRHCETCDKPCAANHRVCGTCMAAVVATPDGHCQLCLDPTNTLLCLICNLGITRAIQRAMGAPAHELAYTPRLEDEQRSVDHLRTAYSSLDGRSSGTQRAAQVVPFGMAEGAA